MDVIPSFYSLRNESDSRSHTDYLNNYALRLGEVKEIIYPEDPRSRTKKHVEYNVVVQSVDNGTIATRPFYNCTLANDFAGFADYTYRALRTDPRTNGVNPSRGSKVLILCLNGSEYGAIIISGIRDDQQSDLGRQKKGLQFESVYNGVALSIADDGSFTVEYRGPTTVDGLLDTKKAKEESVGTTVSVGNDGTFKVSTKKDNQSIVIDHKNHTVSITGDKKMTLIAEKVEIGKDAPEAAVLGDTLVSLLQQLIDAIAALTVPTPVGPSGPPLNNAQFQNIKSRLKTALSQFIKLKKTP